MIFMVLDSRVELTELLKTIWGMLTISCRTAVSLQELRKQNRAGARSYVSIVAGYSRASEERHLRSLISKEGEGVRLQELCESFSLSRFPLLAPDVSDSGCRKEANRDGLVRRAIPVYIVDICNSR